MGKIPKYKEEYPRITGGSSKHETSNENGKIIIQFAEENNIIIKSTLFAHKDIHKETWMSPDGKTRNRIDHILTEKRIL
jgi:predicted class III extradiol MEMO1 family dioxygenase